MVFESDSFEELFGMDITDHGGDISESIIIQSSIMP